MCLSNSGETPQFQPRGFALFPLVDFAAADPGTSFIGSRLFSPGLTVTFKSDVDSSVYFAGKGRLAVLLFVRPPLPDCDSGSMRTLYSPSGAPSPAPVLIEK